MKMTKANPATTVPITLTSGNFSNYTAKKKIPKPPVAKLWFTPYAWAKFKWFRDKGDTEVSLFAYCPRNPLYVEDLLIIKQTATSITVELDETALADFFEDMFDLGFVGEQFARVHCHTHPGMSADPSVQDEETFYEAFGRCDWAIMFILGEDSKYSCALQYNTGPKHRVQISMGIDWHAEFPGTDHKTWEKEYADNITEEVFYNNYHNNHWAERHYNSDYYGHNTTSTNTKLVKQTKKPTKPIEPTVSSSGCEHETAIGWCSAPHYCDFSVHGYCSLDNIKNINNSPDTVFNSGSIKNLDKCLECNNAFSCDDKEGAMCDWCGASFCNECLQQCESCTNCFCSDCSEVIEANGDALIIQCPICYSQTLENIPVVQVAKIVQNK